MNIVANIIGMILVVKPSFAMDAMSNTKSSFLANDAVQSTAIGCIILSALFCQSNTFVLEKQLKGIQWSWIYVIRYHLTICKSLACLSIF